MGRIQGVNLAVYLAWNKNGHMGYYMGYYIPIHRLWSMVWLDDLGLGRDRIRQLMTRKFGEEVSLNGKNVKMLVSHVNALKRVTLTEDFNNHMGRMICFVGTSHPLSSAIPTIAQQTHEQSGHGVRDGSYAWVQQHGLILIKVNLSMATAEFPISQQHGWILNFCYSLQSDQLMLMEFTGLTNSHHLK